MSDAAADDWAPMRLASAVTGLPPAYFERQIGVRRVWTDGVEYRGARESREINMRELVRWIENGDRVGALEDARPPSSPVRRATSGGPTRLYRHFDSTGRLLYVGISLHAIHRLSQHMNAAAWAQEIARVEVSHYATRIEALAAEKLAIEEEWPAHNIVHAPREGP